MSEKWQMRAHRAGERGGRAIDRVGEPLLYANLVIGLVAGLMAGFRFGVPLTWSLVIAGAVMCATTAALFHRWGAWVAAILGAPVMMAAGAVALIAGAISSTRIALILGAIFGGGFGVWIAFETYRPFVRPQRTEV